MWLGRSSKKCPKCGSRIFTKYVDEQNRLSHIMKRDGVCYECAFWEDLIAYPPEYTEVVGVRCLKIYPGIRPKKELGVMLGGKGKDRYFVSPDMNVVCSNDVWSIGVIPERFRDQLKPTLIEITKRAYNKLKRTPKMCQARACFDRYHCFRYNLDLEKENGPYNKIPGNWKVGGEHCGFRIDPSEILTDDDNVQP